MALISGRRRSPGSRIFTFTFTVALARSAVGMICRTTPRHFCPGNASTVTSAGCPSRNCAMLDSLTSASTSSVFRSTSVQIAPAGSVPATCPIMTEEMTSPTSVDLVAMVPSNGARITMSVRLISICDTRACAASSRACALSRSARLVTPCAHSADWRSNSRCASANAARPSSKRASTSLLSSTARTSPRRTLCPTSKLTRTTLPDHFGVILAWRLATM